jgi:hypothetical protein
MPVQSPAMTMAGRAAKGAIPMPIDQDRIRAILTAEHSYYPAHQVPTREDTRLLVPDGLLFCQEIAELHHIEEAEVFWGRSRQEMPRRGDEVRALMEQNGFEVRLAADIITKEYFCDLYAWLECVSNIWSWRGLPFPAADDPRFALFAQRNITAMGEIKTTDHTVWVAAVKQ